MKRMYALLTWSFAAVLLLGACGGGGDTSSGGYRLVKTWGAAGPGQFYNAKDVATDSAGNVYVMDPEGYKIQKFNSAGTHIKSWGTFGYAENEFSGSLYSISVNTTNDHIFVLSGNYVYEFTAGGAFVTRHTVGGGYLSPYAATVSSSGVLFVGKYHSSWTQYNIWSSGTPTVYLSSSLGAEPKFMATDGSGNVYVTLSNNTIRKFNATLGSIATWGAAGTGDGQFSSIQGITVSSDGSSVFVVDGGTGNRVQQFTSGDGITYVYAAQWGAAGPGDGQFTGPAGISLDPTEAFVYVADSGNGRIQKFDTTTPGVYQSKWGTLWTAVDGLLYSPAGVAVDASENVYVVESSADVIKKYDANGTFITQWGSSGAGDGQFSSPGKIAVDTAGNVFVTEYSTGRIQKFETSNGIDYTYVTQWSATANGIAVDASGKVYTTEGNAVVVYSTTTGTDYAPSNTWGATGSGDGQFDMPQGIAVDSSGNVFVADSANNRIQKFDSSGAFTTSWNYAAGISTPLDSPGAIAVDGAGNVYVASASDGYKFSSSGTFLAEFCDAKLRTSGIAVGASGAIYASVSHSIWKFR